MLLLFAVLFWVLVGSEAFSSNGGTGPSKRSKGGGDMPNIVPMKQAQTAREAAFLAALRAERGQGFIADALAEWKEAAGSNLQSSEMGLATLIANVACREALSLDHALEELAKKGEQGVRLKAKQRVLLRTALAQYKYCSRIPVYSIVDDTVKLAKKYGGGQSFAGFVNAVLRNLEDQEPRTLALPSEGDSAEKLAIRFSYPEHLVKILRKDFGLKNAIAIMKAGNAFPPIMVRSRSSEVQGVDPGLELLTDPSSLPPNLSALPPTTSYQLAIVRSQKFLSDLIEQNDSQWYVMNGTPSYLISYASQNALERLVRAQGSSFLRVLDLCASPGGKALAVYDVLARSQNFPLSLTMNDVSEEKKKRIEENVRRYGLLDDGVNEINLVVSDGVRFKGRNDGYDVVIVDTPCSNAGVLSRRPEARWRLKDDLILQQLEETQFALMENAKYLLAVDNPNAEIWYMTCSILKREDEEMIAKVCKVLDLEIVTDHGKPLMVKILPGEDINSAFDGGFLTCLRRRR